MFNHISHPNESYSYPAVPRVRSMEEADLDRVMEIERLSFRYPWQRHCFEAELQRRGISVYMVACDGGCSGPSGREGGGDSEKVLGYGGMWLLSVSAHITTLAVHPLSRRCGVGSLLLQSMFRWARFRGATRLTLEVRPSNRVARNLYYKHGFTVWRVRPGYYCDEDALLMVVDLLRAAPLR